MNLITDRGFCVVSWDEGLDDQGRAAARTALAGCMSDPVVQDRDGLTTLAWGLPTPGDGVTLLSRAPRARSGDLDATAVAQLLRADDPARLREVHPTFGAALVEGGIVRVAADLLGFRHLVTGRGPGWAMISTSSRPLAAMSGGGLDLTGLAVQSRLGWQLGQRTLCQDATKVAPGTRLTMRDGKIVTDDFTAAPSSIRLDLETGVVHASALLRSWLNDYLDDHPDAVLQLTGGQDSRLLLSAIHPNRRRGLRVVTLGVPGSPDVAIASSLAARHGAQHEILSLDGVGALDPEEAWELCLASARRLDFTADPLAHAVLTVVESAAGPGPRISGLGGEVARGFYYLGPVSQASPTQRRARRLARWRMFVNESVDDAMLDSEFAAWADRVAIETVVSVLTRYPGTWLEATDHLYLAHRMQRWGGITETAVCLDRDVVNPMLDQRFLEVANALAPDDKARSRFLSRLQLQLDPDLARIPLEGRPAPVAFTSRSPGNSLRRASATGAKLGRKVAQRLRHANRSPAGGQVVTDRLHEYWRRHPQALETARTTGIFQEEWLDRLAMGDLEARPSDAAFLVNVTAAAQPQS